jgi:hypothetical protein
MSQHQSKAFHWKNDVQQWLRAVLDFGSRTGVDFRIAAQNLQHQFPSSQVVTFVGQQVYQGLSRWAVKTALREAATALNVTIDDETLDFLTDLAMASIVAAA